MHRSYDQWTDKNDSFNSIIKRFQFRGTDCTLIFHRYGVNINELHNLQTKNKNYSPIHCCFPYTSLSTPTTYFLIALMSHSSKQYLLVTMQFVIVRCKIITEILKWKVIFSETITSVWNRGWIKSYRLFYSTLLFLWTYRAFKGSYKNSNFYELYKERNTDKVYKKKKTQNFTESLYRTVLNNSYVRYTHFFTSCVLNEKTSGSKSIACADLWNELYMFASKKSTPKSMTSIWTRKALLTFKGLFSNHYRSL